MSPARTLGLAVATGAVALAAMPARRHRTAAALCAAAGWVALEAGWPGVVGGLALVTAARSLFGGLARTGAPRHGRPRRRSRQFLGFAIARRALGMRMVGPFVGAAVVGLVAVAFVPNNRLDAAVAAGAERLAALSAVTVVIAGLAELLAVRRPAWPWARSMPSSALARVGGDATLLAIAAVPALAVAAMTARGPALAAAAATPTIAALAAGAIRRAAVRSSGASGEVFAGGLLAAAWIALVPAVAVGVLALLPLALAWAAERERGLKATAWHERHHLAAGDPIAWSDR